MAHYLMLLRTFQRPYQYANVTTFAISDDFKASYVANDTRLKYYLIIMEQMVLCSNLFFSQRMLHAFFS